jgi:hypothetical protein
MYCRLRVLAFSHPRIAQTSTIQVRNQTAGDSMSLIKKSDVNSHFSRRSAKRHPFGLAGTNAMENTESKPSGTKVNAPDIGINFRRSISPEPTSNA